MTTEQTEETTVARVDLTCSRCSERGTYDLNVACSNCGFSGIATYSVTHEALYDECPNCETPNLRPKLS